MSDYRGPLVSICAVFCVTLLHGAPAQSPIVPKNLKLALAFERQSAGAGDRYIARGQGYVIALDGSKTTIGILSEADKTGSAVSMEFAGGRRAQPVAGPELPGKVNYIRGNDPTKWKLGLPTYERVSYRD